MTKEMLIIIAFVLLIIYGLIDARLTWKELEQERRISELRTVAEWLREGFKAGLHAREWIPCSEKMPEEPGFYLVTIDKRYADKNELLVDLIVWRDDSWKYMDIYAELVAYPKPVVAWRPLPEPYEENQDSWKEGNR